VTMDFWRKTKPNYSQKEFSDELKSGMSSPLTELSSLESGDVSPNHPQPGTFNVEELKAALFLCGFQEGAQSSKLAQTVSSHPRPISPVKEKAVQTELAWAFASVGTAGPSFTPSASSTVKSESAKRVKRPTTNRATRTASSRALRSSVGSHAPSASIDADGDHPMKAEPTAGPSLSHPQPNGTIVVPDVTTPTSVAISAPSSTSGRPKRIRQPTRKRLPPIPLTASSKVRSTVSMSDIESEDEDGSIPHPMPELAHAARTKTKVGESSSSTGKHRGPPASTSINGTASRIAKPVTPAPRPSTVTLGTPGGSGQKLESAPSTSLKIRLPRLGALSSPSTTATSAVTPAKTLPRAETDGTSRVKVKAGSTRGRRSNRSSGLVTNDVSTSTVDSAQ